MKKKHPHKHKRRHTRKIKTVTLPKVGILRVEAHPEAVPLVVAKGPNVVDVISVHKATPEPPMGWVEYLFGR